MDAADPRHGTSAGYHTHRRELSTPCTACRAAYNAYMRTYRSTRDVKARVQRETNARGRALWRLAALHRDEFQRLYLIELGPPVMEEAP